jgi:hypothetical protein
LNTAKITLLLFLATTALHAQEAELAQKLANPISDLISQLLKISDQPLQAFAGARFYIDKPADGPEWGLRFGLTFLFPK